jgi:hypothetical protein
MRPWIIVIAVTAVAAGVIVFAVLGRKRTVQRPANVLVPAGTFRASYECAPGFERGCDAVSPTGRPRYRVIVWLDAFWADAGLIKREAYEACRQVGACTGTQDLSKDSWPCNARSFAWVTFDDARAYCAWRGGRLPTADEFERMGRWTDGRRYAGGESSVRSQCDMRESPERIRELNLFDQWVASPTGEAGKQGGVASWHFTPGREGMSPFRCVRSLKSGPNPGRALVWPHQDEWWLPVWPPQDDPWLDGGPDI